jgi:hypothetical protein
MFAIAHAAVGLQPAVVLAEASPSSNPDSNSAAFKAGELSVDVLNAVIVLGLVLLVVGLIVRYQRRRTRAGTIAIGVPTAPPQMSPDGRYWWDGRSWRDAQVEVPPSAQRSADGHFWWDGRQWRPLA